MPQDSTTRPAATQRFRALIWPHLPMVLRAAQYLCHHSQDAEDLAQDTMMKALRALDRYQEGGDVRAWLLTILRHAHIDLIRSGKHRWRQASLDDEGAPEPADPASDPAAAPAIGAHDAHWHDPAALFEQFEDQEVIAALKALPGEIRWTLLLVDVEQLDHADAARVLDVPVGTVKSRTHRGRGMLRDKLYEAARRRGLTE